MGLILVQHDTDSPALYGAVAAAVAMSRNCGFMHIAAHFDTARHADAEQHVVATGGLAASGLCWFERLSGKPVSPPATVGEVLDAARLADVVVPVHQAFMAEADAASLLAESANEVINVVEREDHFIDGETDVVLAWRDRFGRVVLKQAEAAPAAAMKIALVGAESDHFGVYPAALASLADAADSLSAAVDIDFIDPVDFRDADAGKTLQPYAGILLPGGSDMKNVARQTAVAAFALDNAVPIVGLCLGMQTMATAVAWKTFGRENANLAEADPDADIKTFRAMAGEKTAGGGLLPEHRTGDQITQPIPGTRLAALIGADTSIRCNHRFRLNPELVEAMEMRGLRVAARGVDGAIVDAIEVIDHPFYIGMQGHPELSSRTGAPHPLIVAFLQAALLRQSQAAV